MTRLALGLVLLAALCGCGYRLAGRGNALPPEVQTLYVELFANRTHEPFVEDRLTDLVIGEFARRPGLRLTEDRDGADAVLSGTVTRYETAPVSYGRDDEITEYRATLALSALLSRRSDGKALWKGTLDWTEEYPSSDDKSAQEDNEEAAIAEVSARLAEELYFRVVDSF